MNKPILFPLTVREQIIALIQEAGYDTISACEMADQCIRETPVNSSKRWHVGPVSFTLAKQ